MDKLIIASTSQNAGKTSMIIGLAKALNKKFPMIVGVVPSLELGALAAIQSNWARAGEMCADKADRILKGTPANNIPITFPDKVNIGLNLKVAEKLGVTIPFEWNEAAGSTGKIIE